MKMNAANKIKMVNKISRYSLVIEKATRAEISF